jgi:hypothetical protein
MDQSGAPPPVPAATFGRDINVAVSALLLGTDALAQPLHGEQRQRNSAQRADRHASPRRRGAVIRPCVNVGTKHHPREELVT